MKKKKIFLILLNRSKGPTPSTRFTIWIWFLLIKQREREREKEREGGNLQEENRRCASPDERENRNIFVLRSALTAARPLPHCQRHAIEIGLIGFFFCLFLFCSDFISLWERLYFLISLHFLYVFCSDCILLQLVAAEIKAGFFFFFFWVLILLVYEKDCIL